MGRVDCIMGNPLSLYPSPGQGGGYCENDVVCVMGKVDCIMGKVGAVRLALTFHERKGKKDNNGWRNNFP